MVRGLSRRARLVVPAALAAAGLVVAFASYGARAPLERGVVEPEPAPALRLPAFSAEEERFAAALWPVHGEVKLAAIKVTFAGIRHAQEGGDTGRLSAEIEPALEALERAAAAVDRLGAPESLEPVRQRYRRAVELYREAALLMLQAAPEGDRARLLEAQRKSMEASEETLRVGDRLWPAEYKPH